MAVEWCAGTEEIPAASIQPAVSAPTDLISCRMGLSLAGSSVPVIRRNGSSMAPGGFFHRDEDVVAIGIDPFCEVAGLADALNGVELARTLAEKDARRLPGLGQNL